MKQNITALIAGLLMGAGFVVSGMTDPEKVQNFLDITGQWDPTLMLVMGGAILVNLPATWLILKRRKPVAASRFHLPEKTQVDRRLVAGAILFGAGWGLAGICPGPGIARLLVGGSEVVLFLIAMMAGFALENLYSRFLKKAH
ncbi:MAG: DUF6691 family protein [Endozoicomonas sp.]